MRRSSHFPRHNTTSHQMPGEWKSVCKRLNKFNMPRVLSFESIWKREKMQNANGIARFHGMETFSSSRGPWHHERTVIKSFAIMAHTRRRSEMVWQLFKSEHAHVRANSNGAFSTTECFIFILIVRVLFRRRTNSTSWRAEKKSKRKWERKKEKLRKMVQTCDWVQITISIACCARGTHKLLDANGF